MFNKFLNSIKLRKLGLLGDVSQFNRLMDLIHYLQRVTEKLQRNINVESLPNINGKYSHNKIKYILK